MFRRSLEALALAGALTLSVSVAAVAQSPAASPAAGGSPAASADASPCPAPAESPAASETPTASGAPEASLGVPAATVAPSAAPDGDAQASAAASLPAASPAASSDAAASPAADDCAPAEVLEIETPASEPLTFSTDTLTAPAGTLVRVEYLNDSNVPHNITFFEGSDANAPRIAGTELGAGPGNLQVVEFTTPSEPGSYFFHCDVHPTLMTGTFEVTAAG